MLRCWARRCRQWCISGHCWCLSSTTIDTDTEDRRPRCFPRKAFKAGGWPCCLLQGGHQGGWRHRQGHHWRPVRHRGCAWDGGGPAARQAPDGGRAPPAAAVPHPLPRPLPQPLARLCACCINCQRHARFSRSCKLGFCQRRLGGGGGCRHPLNSRSEPLRSAQGLVLFVYSFIYCASLAYPAIPAFRTLTSNSPQPTNICHLQCWQ
jgi:hypothetical protein